MLKEKIHEHLSRFNAYRNFYVTNKNKSIQNPKVEIDRRAALDLFEIEDIIAPLPEYYYFFNPDANYYGILSNLLLYAGIDIEQYNNKNSIYLEHGLYCSNTDYSFKSRNAIKIITLSPFRKEIIDSYSKKEVLMVGPYIHYAKGLYTDEYIQKLKNDFGKTLLYFPSHSLPSHELHYNRNYVIDKIDDIYSSYKTKIVCLYYNDATRENIALYRERGYLVVSAGHINDYNFLRRLKSIMSLGDIVVSNKLGTHIGYSLYLNIPNHIIPQDDIKAVNKGNFSKLNKIISNESILNFTKKHTDYIERLFLDTSQHNITPSQQDVLEYYWGSKCVMSSDELLKALQ